MVSFKYRPSLDGLRVLAVYVVVLFHAGVPGFSNGFIGVDLFFVLSGFLISSILIRELDETGAIDYQKFYARRMRRLLPAALTVLALVSIVTVAFISRVESLPTLRDASAALTYTSNLHLITESRDYFGGGTESGLEHFWSLSIEEQFYFFFPLLLAFSFKLRSKFKHAPLVVIGSVLMISLGLQIWMSNDVSRAYFGTDTRIYQMLTGSVLAYALSFKLLPKAPHYKVVLPALVVLFLMIASIFTELKISYIGIEATVISVLLIWVLESGESSTKAVMEHPVVVTLGKLSYGVYLWHWPIIVLLKQNNVTSVGALALASILGGTFLAYCSSLLVERRFSGAFRMPSINVVACGVGASLVVFAFIPMLRSIAPEDKWEEYYLGTPPPTYCYSRDIKGCTVVEGDGLRVHVIGDSYADLLNPALTATAQKEGWHLTMTNFNVCAWQMGVEYPSSPALLKACREGRNETYVNTLGVLAPDIIILAGQPLERLINNESLTSPLINGPSEQVFRESTVNTLDALSEYNVIIVEPTPSSYNKEVTSLLCLSRGGNNDSCGFVPDDDSLTQDFYREMSERYDNVATVNFDTVFCGEETECTVTHNGVPVFRDEGHLTVAYSEIIGTELGDIIIGTME